MARNIFTPCMLALSVLAGAWAAARADDSPDFTDLLSLLNEHHGQAPVIDLNTPEDVQSGIDVSKVETTEIMIPETTVPEDGGTYCHSEILDPSERYIVGFNPIVDSDDVSSIALYGCPQGPSSEDLEWQCSASGGESVCEGPSVQMFSWAKGGCEDVSERGELITIGGEYIKHVVLVVTYKQGGHESTAGLELKLMSTEFKDTPGLTKTVQFYSNEMSYSSKCSPEVEDQDSSSSSEQPETGSSEESPGDSSSQAATDQNGESDEAEPEEEQQVDDNPEIKEPMAVPDDDGVIDESALESSMTSYESSEPRYESYPDFSSQGDEYIKGSSAVDEDLLADSASLNIDSAYFGDESFEDESSIGAMIKYLAEYFDPESLDRPGLTSTGWWPRQEMPIGQIAGLDIDSMGHLVLFRRGERSWKPDDFDEDNVYIYDTPIQEQPLLVVDPMTGSIMEAWGKNRFYLPHGLTIDRDNNVWLTDVAMHQVFKYNADSDQPEMTFGEAFTPGSDVEHLCKPTDVAICPKSGSIFIADGYCNSRILKFDVNGTFEFEIRAHNSDEDDIESNLSEFRIPHSLAVVESRSWVCVADRENARIQCFNMQDGSFAAEITSPEFGREIFAIAYCSAQDVLYAVNGPQLHRTDIPTSGFTLDIDSGEILEKWTPDPEHFGILHDIAVSGDDGAVFVADIESNRVWRFEKDTDVLSNMIY